MKFHIDNFGKCERKEYSEEDFIDGLGPVSRFLRTPKTTYIGPMAYLIHLYAEEKVCDSKNTKLKTF